ncbi:MAG: hypothetical protein LBE13_13310 [Bacteroidales bacterium]|jgi:hypothetical protein|nr:hypothetical protein [Bacteroidales bacterium]
MKKNNSNVRYGSLSNLTELKYEKQLLHYKIEQKEKRIKKDWNTIYNRWNFISVATNSLRSIIHYIPVGVAVMSQIINAFNNKRT